MAHAPSASDKEKTARLVESLSRHDQVELLAQALLREYMHRRGLRETLRAFDAENPRDERTISSRALMRQLLNIPVEGRPSRLQPTSSGGKSQAATFMEELCSYRLTKRECAAQRQRGAAAGGEALEDPSDVELRALHAAVDARRVAKASCEQKQREFEELLAADVAYRRRKEEHKEKKRHKKRGQQAKHGSRQRAGAGPDGEDDDEDEAEEAWEDNASAAEESEADEAEEEGTSRGGSSAISPPSRGGKKKASRRHASDLVVGSGWQPPGLASAGATTTGAAEGSTWRQPRHASGDGGRLELGSASRSGAQRDRADGGNEGSADDDDEAAAADPFGPSGSSRRAWMERVRAESGRWPTHNSNSSSGAADGGGGLAPGGGGSGGHGRGGGTPATQLSALHALGGQGSAALGQTALGSIRGLGGGRGLAGAGFSSAIATAPPSASASHGGGGGGGLGTLRMRAAGPIPIPGMSEPEGGGGGGGRPPGMYGGSSGYMPPPPLSAAPSILVKHTDGVGSGSNSASASPVHSYDRSAVPRSSAMAGGSSNNSSTASSLLATRAASPTGAGGSAGRAVVRSPSPKALNVGDSPSSPSAFHTPSRAGGGASAGAGGSGLRHGIGFRTASTSAEGTAAGAASSLTASAAAAGGTAHGDGGSASKSNRKERRVKLLVD